MKIDQNPISITSAGFFGRLRIYLTEMFPLHLRLVETVLLTGSFGIMLFRIHSIELFHFSIASLVSVLSILLILLLLRLMDELKDKEIDLQLFSDRPLPSGRIRESDLKIAMSVTVGIYLLINFLMGMIIFWAACALIAYTFLMFGYFFIPNILRRNLLLNLMTHNPVVPLMLIYLVVVFASSSEFAWQDIEVTTVSLLILMYWGVLFSWEITRKIRSEEEENAYVTYSQLLNRTGAVILAAGAQSVTFLLAIYFFSKYSFSAWSISMLSLVYLYILYGHVRFLSKPAPATSNLKAFTERYAMVLFLVVIFENYLF